MSGEIRGGIGTRSAAALVAANMIGAGVFTTSGFALADLGRRDVVLLAWLVGGVIALCGALSYAELSRRIPGNGGEYLFLSRAMHPAVGFLAGWVSLFAGFTAPIAVAAHGLEAYLAQGFGFEAPSGLIGATAILACGVVHAGARRETSLGLQDAAVAAKLVAIGLFLLLGAWAILGDAASWIGTAPTSISSSPSPSSSLATSPPLPLPAFSAFAVTLVWISFAYSGWNAAVYVAGEIDRPARTLPRALVAATLGVTALYVALNAVFLWSAPIEALAGRAEVGAIAAEALGGLGARRALAGVVALGLLTSVSAMIMVGPRVYAQMARDGLFPKGLVPIGAVPRGAIALQVILALAAFFLGDLRDLLLYVGFLLGISAALTVGCLLLPAGAEAPAATPNERRRSYGRVARDGRAVIFVVATLGAAAFTVVREPMQAAAGGATLLVGLGVYALFDRRRRPATAGRR